MTPNKNMTMITTNAKDYITFESASWQDILWHDLMAQRVKFVKSEESTMKMPNITNYTYTPRIGLTTIEWSDGTKTTVRAEEPAKADQYTGFVTAYAKKAAGNTNNINNLFDEWAIERPKRETKRMSDEMVARIEAQKKQERDNKKREKRLIRREALRLKREYEAKKLAKEKYGVPVDDV